MPFSDTLSANALPRAMAMTTIAARFVQSELRCRALIAEAKQMTSTATFGTRAAVAPLTAAVLAKDVAGVQALVDAAGSERKFLRKRDGDGRSALHWAASRSSVEVVAALLAADVVEDVGLNVGDDAGWTPLMLAASAGQLASIDALLAAGADANVRNNNRQTAIAFHKGRAEVVERLAPRTRNVDAQDKYGLTALHRAASSGSDPLCVRALLAAGADPNVADKEGNTCLHLASECGHQPLFTLLLEEGGADPDQKNKEGKKAHELSIHRMLRVLPTRPEEES